MAFVRANGVVLHYDVRGADGRPPLVFCNSLGTDFRIWNGIAERLAGDYRIILYDKRGHGLSEATPGPYAMTMLVEDLAALLDHLSVDRAAIVGISVGGMIAQGLAALRPDLVAALVLMDTAHRIGTEEGWNARIGSVTDKGMNSVADGILQGWFTDAYRTGMPDFAGYRAMLTRNDVEGYAGVCAALRDADLTESSRALKVRTLCMTGDGDLTTTPAIMRSTADLIEGARFEVVADARHLPCIEQPDAVSNLIRGFLDTTGYA